MEPVIPIMLVSGSHCLAMSLNHALNSFYMHFSNSLMKARPNNVLHSSSKMTNQVFTAAFKVTGVCLEAWQGENL